MTYYRMHIHMMQEIRKYGRMLRSGITGSGKSIRDRDTDAGSWKKLSAGLKIMRDLKRIIVCTNGNLAAPKNYESVGFTLYDRKPNEAESAYTGDYLYYEIVL